MLAVSAEQYLNGTTVDIEILHGVWYYELWTHGSVVSYGDTGLFW